jgi:osmotically inducible protein OsmC
MPTRKATASWSGDLPSGNGNMAFGSGAFEGAFSFRSRFEDGTGTNPEELIGAAHAGCFSMAFSNVLAEAGFTPDRVETTAHVTLEMTDEDGPTITEVALDTVAEVPGIDNETFQQYAAAAKEGCPVSKALDGTEITLKAKLASSASA